METDAHAAEPPYARRQCRGRVCEAAGCSAPAAHRAPRGRDALDSYRWFCRDHARAFNAGWNYCTGMSDAEIEARIRRDTVWERPSWRLGSGGAPFREYDDAFGLFGRGRSGEPSGTRDRLWPPGSAEAKAMAELELTGRVTLADVKARRKALAMRHHPDRNNGCKRAEERLKRINQAYETLYKSLSS